MPMTYLTADDITIYCTGKTIADVHSKLQQCVNNSLSWLHQNKLMINPSKSSSMLIGTKQKIENLTLNIQINNCTIDYVNHFKLLGVTIDSNLTWNIQTTNVCKKISSRIGLIRRLKNVLPSHVCVCVCFCTITQKEINTL